MEFMRLQPLQHLHIPSSFHAASTNVQPCFELLCICAGGMGLRLMVITEIADMKWNSLHC